jgi:hypothetical protein
MKLNDVVVHDNRINFISLNSYQYKEIFNHYCIYLKENFTFEEQRSIFFHEIVHWLRLLAYKINTSKKKAIIFYAAFIIVINDVIKLFGNITDEK